MEQLETPNLAGERIFLEATGDNLAKYTEYSLTALGRQYRLMGTYLPVPQPTRDYQSVLIFTAAGKSKSGILKQQHCRRWTKPAFWAPVRLP